MQMCYLLMLKLNIKYYLHIKEIFIHIHLKENNIQKRITFKKE